MKMSTGRWVSGSDFFDRAAELRILEEKLREGNHVALVGQRRIGKTSVVQELGRRIQQRGGIFLFVDVEGADCAEEAITKIAEAAFFIRPFASRIVEWMKHWFPDGLEQIDAAGFSARFRAGVNPGNWRNDGDRLLREISPESRARTVLLAVDELPIFLMRMRDADGSARRVDEFLSWLRSVVQTLGRDGPTLIVSGSIGLQPLVTRLGLSDRINYLYPFSLGPWDRDTTLKCIDRLARSYKLDVADGVAENMHELLGLGIPQHVQSFFARLRDYSIQQGREQVTVADVAAVYRNDLLGPSGQNDLSHYETRLTNALGDTGVKLAMEILAEAAVRDVFSAGARIGLERLYATELGDEAATRINEVLDVLVHDGYLQPDKDGYRFLSRLLKDWWSARFWHHYVPLERRFSDTTKRGPTP